MKLYYMPGACSLAANFTVEMDKSARLEAPGCSVYSNSTKPNGLMAKNSATMRAAFISLRA